MEQAAKSSGGQPVGRCEDGEGAERAEVSECSGKRREKNDEFER